MTCPLPRRVCVPCLIHVSSVSHLCLCMMLPQVTDIAGSMNFVLLAWLTFLLSSTYYTRQIVILAMVTVWGMRLGLFLLIRVIKRGKDERFDEMREKYVHGHDATRGSHVMHVACGRTRLLHSWYVSCVAMCVVMSARRVVHASLSLFSFWSFLGFWIFQMIWVFTVSLSGIFGQSANVVVAIGARDIIGWILWVSEDMLASATSHDHTGSMRLIT